MFIPNERLHDTASVAAPDAPQESPQIRPLPKRPSDEQSESAERAAAPEPRAIRDRITVPRMMKHPG